jgi:Ran GTPase-activating protein (RanGAP) involved in mRNA processing and transport
MLLAGAVLGVVLVLGAGALLVGVEHRDITTATSLAQGAGNVGTVDAARVDAANEGKLVHLTAEAVPASHVTDPVFGISTRALRLVRETEAYVWKETKKESKKDKEKTTTYSYDGAWSHDKPPASRSFNTSKGHENPTDKPYPGDKFKAADVKVGAFTLTPAQVDQVPATEALPLTEDMLSPLPDALKGKVKLTSDGWLFKGANPDAPQVGDARIRYKVAKPQTVTVVARQSGNSFTPYPSTAGGTVDIIKPGALTPQAMFEAAQSSSGAVTWVLRAASFLLLAGGLFLILRPVASQASGLDPAELSFNIRVGIFAVGFALALALVVVGGRRLLYQPPLGMGLLVGGLVLLVLDFLLSRSAKLGLGGGATVWTPEEREAFRRVALEPANARARQDLAAQLERKGEPMGELMRVDESLEAIPEGDARRADLDSRWMELVNANGRTWFAPLKRLGLEPILIGNFFPALWMKHGIIDEVVIDVPGVLPEKAEQLFAAAPGLRVLDFNSTHVKEGGGWDDTTYNPDVPAIVRLPQLEQIGVLKLSSLSLKLEDLEAIATSPSLQNLTELEFRGNVGARGAVALAQSPHLKRMRVLELRGCDLGEQGAAALAGSASLAGLVTLNLGSNAIGPAGAQALATSPHLKKLEQLILDDNAIGSAGGRALAASPNFRALTVLDLGRNDLGPEGGQALAGSANLARVATLKLNDNRLGAGLRFLAASPHLGSVKVLELQTNEIDAEGAKALAAGTVIKQLETLELSYNAIGDDGLKALAGWAGLARVQKLTLRDNKIGAVGAAVLASSPHVVGLKELDLSNNDLGVAGARALAGSANLRSLTSLWIQTGNLTSEGESLLKKRFGEAVHLS